jgi:hypothetical protein
MGLGGEVLGLFQDTFDIRVWKVMKHSTEIRSDTSRY